MLTIEISCKSLITLNLLLVEFRQENVTKRLLLDYSDKSALVGVKRGRTDAKFLLKTLGEIRRTVETALIGNF
jgi:hypothetical protein